MSPFQERSRVITTTATTIHFLKLSSSCEKTVKLFTSILLHCLFYFYRNTIFLADLSNLPLLENVVFFAHFNYFPQKHVFLALSI